MDCPKCGKGKMRVVTIVACSCGHHPFICDDCAQQFTIPHHVPAGTLPPDAALEEEVGHQEVYEGLMKELGEQHPQPYREMMRATIAETPEHFPLLEDFKASQSS